MLQRLTDRIVERRIRLALSPEHVREFLDETLDVLRAGMGHIGLDEAWLKYFESMLDLDELAATLSARLIHMLRAE